jgi:hypothetical protein
MLRVRADVPAQPDRSSLTLGGTFTGSRQEQGRFPEAQDLAVQQRRSYSMRQHFFVVAPQGSDLFGKSVFTAAQSLRATIGPFPVQRDVVVRMERNASGTDASLAVTLAGELVNP